MGYYPNFFETYSSQSKDTGDQSCRQKQDTLFPKRQFSVTRNRQSAPAKTGVKPHFSQT